MSVSPTPGTLDRGVRRMNRVSELATALHLMPTPERFLKRPSAKRAGPPLPAWLGGAKPTGVTVRKDGFEGPGGHVAVHVYGPADSTETLPGILYLHGGGWVGGGLRLYDRLCAELSSLTGARVVSVDYRLAPECPFPDPLDDAAAGLQWTVDNAGALGIDPARLGVAGDSAGGSLAAALAIRARDEGLPTLAFQALLYPALDATMSTDSMASYPGPGLVRADMVTYYRAYGADAERTLPQLSPLLLDDVTGLPPAVVVTAGFDCLRDEGFLYAAKLRAAGVPTEHQHYADAPHGFLSLAGICSQAAPAFAFLTGGIRAALTTDRREPSA